MSGTILNKVVTNGLVLYVDAANQRSYTSGSNQWIDISTNTNIGILSGSGVTLPTYDPLNQGVLQFTSASRQLALINTPSQLVTGGAISVAIWAKWTTKSGDITNIQALVDNDHSVQNRGFIMQDRPDQSQKLQFCVLRNTTGVLTVGNTSGVVNGVVGDGTWKYIVGTNDLTNDRIYVNGVLNNTAADAGGINVIQPRITIGAVEAFSSGGGHVRWINGSIALVMIYNRALSADEVLQNYNVTKARFQL